MSTGPRIPVAVAFAKARCLMAKWGMAEGPCAIVGSLRRGRDSVGDIDLIAPMPTSQRDDLYETIAATMHTEGLFADDGTTKIGRAIRGLKPGFRSCELIVKSKSCGEIPVQIGRFDAGDKGNRGWIEIIRTGPAEFGQWFLAKWKTRWDIPRERQGSEEGYLLDIAGRKVATPTERTCFDLMAMPYIPPEARETRRS